MIFDAHTHLFSHAYYSALVKQKLNREPNAEEVQAEIAALGLQLPPADAAEHAGMIVASMDRHGIEHAVLFTSLPGEQTAVATAASASAGRLIGFTMVNPHAPNALETARGDIATLGLRGLELFPAMHRFDPSDEKLIYPFYQLASELNVPVFCHVGLLRVRLRERLGLPCKFDLRFSDPLLLHRAAVDHPGVKFIIPHFGCGFLREAAFLGHQCPNVYIDTSSSNNWLNLLPAPTTLARALEVCLLAFGPDRILYGTDTSTLPRGYRTDVREALLGAFDSLNLDNHSREKILGRNMEQLLMAGI